MTALQQRFLSVLRCALLGQPAKEPENLSPEDCTALLTLAQSHRILPLFFEAVYTWDRFRDNPICPPVRQQVRQQVLTQTLRTAQFLQLNQQLVAARLQPLVVKGIICRSLYPHPDHRPSGDEDMLIPASQFQKCHEIFTQFGLVPGLDAQPDLNSYEIPYRKAGSPLYIELHKQLFPPESTAYGEFNRFFEGVAQRAVQIHIQDLPVWTMDPTDHLLYLIFHAFKHFFHSGFGIRQLCDIILFANRYGSEILWQRIVDSCRAIRAEKFTVALFKIGGIHLVFDPEQACFPEQWRTLEVDENAMLEDLLAGGLYGDNSKSRVHSSNITLDAISAHKQGKQKQNPLAVSLFPPAHKLRKRYPYLKDKPWLLPVAWTSRILTYRSQSRKDPDNTASEALKIGKNRLALMKQYEIIP